MPILRGVVRGGSHGTRNGGEAERPAGKIFAASYCVPDRRRVHWQMSEAEADLRHEGVTMKRFTVLTVVGLGLILFLTGPGQPQVNKAKGQRPGDPATVAAAAREELRDLLLDVREARTLAAAVGDRNVRDRLELALARIERRADAVQRLLFPGGVAPVVEPVSAQDFARLLKSVQGQAFDDAKLPLVENAARHGYFTCAQAAELVKQFRFSQGKTRTAILLYPRLVDPVNFHEVLDAMPFPSDKDTVRKALGLGR